MAVDSVTLEILKNHCRAAAESMAFTLYRTAHSTFVKETEDFTTGLTTPNGETFATPTELGATWFVGLNYKKYIQINKKLLRPSKNATLVGNTNKAKRFIKFKSKTSIDKLISIMMENDLNLEKYNI